MDYVHHTFFFKLIKFMIGNEFIHGYFVFLNHRLNHSDWVNVIYEIKRIKIKQYPNKVRLDLDPLNCGQ